MANHTTARALVQAYGAQCHIAADLGKQWRELCYMLNFHSRSLIGKLPLEESRFGICARQCLFIRENRLKLSWQQLQASSHRGQCAREDASAAHCHIPSSVDDKKGSTVAG